MKTIFHPAAQRGFANHGWLQAAHSFSFAQYYDPAKVHFGQLRVLNDDIVAPAMGFGTHGHDNMEIVTIPLRGSLAHKDSLGSVGTITPGEVQIMSAGSGMQHSEFNASETEEVICCKFGFSRKNVTLRLVTIKKHLIPAWLKTGFNSLFLLPRKTVLFG